ncbi:MAG: hypothetical protein QW096_12145, partial [Thermofilaceae archaeon]
MELGAYHLVVLWRDPVELVFPTTTTISILKLGMALTERYARALSMFNFVGFLVAIFSRSRYDLSFTCSPDSASTNVR